MSVCGRGVPQPDGSVLLVLDPAQTDLTACAYVVDTGADYSGWRALANLSIPDAEIIAAQIAVLWAVVWGIKQIGKAILAKDSISERD